MKMFEIWTEGKGFWNYIGNDDVAGGIFDALLAEPVSGSLYIGESESGSYSAYFLKEGDKAADLCTYYAAKIGNEWFTVDTERMCDDAAEMRRTGEGKIKLGNYLTKRKKLD